MRSSFPDIMPYETGFLNVSNGHKIHFAVSGNRDGRPAVLLHGGPGSAMSASARRYFDPQHYRIIQFDQRGCGLSTPNAADSLEYNTTGDLIADMEALRQELGVESWLVFGNSWGSTLALAYAEQYPQRVDAIILAGVTTTRQREIDWLYKGLAMFMPREWARFMDAIPPHLRGDDPVDAYHALLTDADPAIRLKAARDWHDWEQGSISSDPSSPPPARWANDAYILARARLCAHYFHHRAWLDDTMLIDNAHKLNGIPVILIQGSRDLQGPPVTAVELAAAWSTSELMLVDKAGHSTADEGMQEAIMCATARFAMNGA
jgi:proline iminopeptidase